MSTTRVVMATGIGGQGIQLATHVLAQAAMTEGREVQLFSSYGGMMRGGNTEATLVLNDSELPAIPPIAPSLWCGLVMHHEYVDAIADRVDAGTILYVNSSVVGPDVLGGAESVIRLPVLDIATDLDAPMAASLILLAAACKGTQLVSLSSLHAAAEAAIPPYRTQHIEANNRALDAGYNLVDKHTNAWKETE